MTKKMLIDAAHAEETRVVVLDGAKIEDFDFESRAKKQLRGNIYLAKVTRVEPSLQAAFIEYGGNRHGFLSFDEIHPDYYQIPAADREALLAEEAAAEAEHRTRAPRTADAEHVEGDAGDANGEGQEHDDDDLEEESARRRARLRRRYKIQEVIKRRQIMLVQVVKDERGAKGAALTTYLSLAGRYGVLMPNTARGGGISRKITAAADRKRLKTIVQSLDVPEGMGLIIRTAGAKRTKAEIKRDYDYLLRLWENIRDTTLKSIAPAAIHEEDDLVKRAIRDMYDKEIDGIWVQGEQGFREARDFMRMLMPSQAKKVILHETGEPLFVKEGVEGQLSQIYSPVVPLRSGGYLVINQTEALVAIDVNSGKSTRERNIESTALKTNLEAASEAARQLRLRDLAGLIVIDFIDMDEGKNNRAVEKVLKDALAFDRARVQMGKISGFGLMEISRQRRRTGVLEGTTHVCEHCQGMGRVRSVESSALAALRALDIEAVKGSGELVLRAPPEVAIYILNHKREYLARLEASLGLFVAVRPDASLTQTDHAIDWVNQEEPRQAPPTPVMPAVKALPEDDFDDEELEDEEDERDEEAGEDRRNDAVRADRSSETDGDGVRGKRRRRRRRGGRPDEERDETPRAAQPEAADGDEAAGRRRRRGRRGGRRPREDEQAGGDGFAWTRPRVPFDDPFQWHDPAALDAPRALEPRTLEAAAPEQAPAAAAPPAPPKDRAPRERGRGGRGRQERAPTKAPADEIWVELPAQDAPAAALSTEPAAETEAAVDPAPVKKPSRSRKKADTAPAPAQALEPAAVETSPAPKRRSAARKPKVANVEIAETPQVAIKTQPPESPAEPAPPPAPVEPDPAEITAKPATPKRGWWRRG